MILGLNCDSFTIINWIIFIFLVKRYVNFNYCSFFKLYYYKYVDLSYILNCIQYKLIFFNI